MLNNAEYVKVAVRCRPISSREINDNQTTAVEMNTSKNEIMLKNLKLEKDTKIFTFDNVYDWNFTQENIYKEMVYPMREAILEGYNRTIFAYGHTNAGKTHTIIGTPAPKELRQVFAKIKSTPNTQYLVRVSFLELYNEEIRELLANNMKNKRNLMEQPDAGVYVKDLTSFVVQDVGETYEKLQIGRKNRAISALNRKGGSLKSHSIFTITVEASCSTLHGQNYTKIGKLNLVDLAGSNTQSLTALRNVTFALADVKCSYVPYRDSNLTTLLQDFLCGDTKALMIANISAGEQDFDETVNTLTLASMAKNIKNTPKINENSQDSMMRQFQEELGKLKAQLNLNQDQKILKDVGEGES